MGLDISKTCRYENCVQKKLKDKNKLLPCEYCYDHTCKEEQCNEPRVIYSLYCSFHKCRNKSCIEERNCLGFCDKCYPKNNK